MSALRRRRLAAALLPHLGYTRCLRCGLPWWRAQRHTVWHAQGRGIFALCERCWLETTPAERVAAVRELVDVVSPDRPEDDREAVIRAYATAR